MRFPRASGILLHPTSLPGRFGIGDLGPSAEAFVAFLADSGQKWWQILPIGPTGDGHSPYQSPSSFAGNRLLISPERLADRDLLSADDWRDLPEPAAGRVDYGAASAVKDRLLRIAFGRFDPDRADYREFLDRSAGWLPDYALYTALKGAHDGSAWTAWEPEAALRHPDALARWRERLDEPYRYECFLQYAFDRQWRALRELCRARGVGLIGDMPIFVSHDSADVWARPDLFELDERGMPTVVAGVPPDYFSATGQRWGNPHYRWPNHHLEGFAWWIARIRSALDRVDLVRLDHFRGFDAYWEVPAEAETAAHGRWALGPGTAFLQAVKDGLGGLPLIAEDLGVITPEVEALRDRFELPGMRVLQFAFGDDPMGDQYLPYKHIPHCVVYTGTHDNDTTLGWLTSEEVSTTQSRELIAAERAFVRRFLGPTAEPIHWALIRLAFGSVGDTVIVPMQDLLGLGSDARMNLPGSAEGNWCWRYRPEHLSQDVRDRLADLTAVYGRWNGPVPLQWRTPRRLLSEGPLLAR